MSRKEWLRTTFWMALLVMGATGCVSEGRFIAAEQAQPARNPLCLSAEMDRLSNPQAGAMKVQPPECKPEGAALRWTTEAADEPLDFNKKDEEE